MITVKPIRESGVMKETTVRLNSMVLEAKDRNSRKIDTANM